MAGEDKIRGGRLHPPPRSSLLQVPPSPCEGAEEGRCWEGIRQVVTVAMEKAAGQRHLIGGGGGGGKKAGSAVAGLQKQNSWSPDIERDEAWERRRRGMRRGGTALRRVRSVTDDDLDELRGCIDLGFGFEPPPAGSGSGSGCAACGCAGRNRLVETLPALDLYYAVHGGADGVTCSCGAASEVSSEESPLGSPMSILSPGDPPETVKMRLKQWAQVVALSMLSRH